MVLPALRRFGSRQILLHPNGTAIAIACAWVPVFKNLASVRP